ncbi:E3 ubiquitin-protein ligase BIG BROTHER-like [Syzygium oleosum]|uniref:E3 ubiquitin-protein ligase BIG BROTHER-like n=1 Tax=Syzygium oleosum TaxID=219896 RepID=UPI0024BA8E9B|nr:E3 ubiquitin-protein ligase BIG BROTHER-like [Syzygium oleosum]
MDFGMLEPLCVARQIPDYDLLEASDRRVFYMEVHVKFVYLAEPPSAPSDCQGDRLMPKVSREERHEFRIDADQLSQDADVEWFVRYMLTTVGVMYSPRHEFMVRTVLCGAASVARDERNRDANVLPMRVSISCADPSIHPELTSTEEGQLAMAYDEVEGIGPSEDEAYDEGEDIDAGEDEGLVVAFDEGEDMDTSEDEEEVAMIGPWLKGLTEVEVTEGSTDCAICCDVILAGSKGSSMPCCHVYHRECIAKWLKKSRTCPLCRFKLPSTY